MTHHSSLRQHLLERAERGHPPEFTPSQDPTLVEFARIFADTGVYSLDVNKHRPEDEFWAAYVLVAEIVRAEGSPPEVFEGTWSPVEPGQDLLEGFLAGASSALFGSNPGQAMPPEELSAALLLLVTSDFTHLSASREQEPPLVRGAVDLAGEDFGYLVLKY
ncbi:MAG: hypothetical protein JWO63_2798 [Frankiales bacterium]|nr:hypothetical protein [Frankiales bacterium]